MKISEFKVWLNGFKSGLKDTKLTLDEIIEIILKKVDEIDSITIPQERELEKLIDEIKIPNGKKCPPYLPQETIVMMYGCIRQPYNPDTNTIITTYTGDNITMQVKNKDNE